MSATDLSAEAPTGADAATGGVRTSATPSIWRGIRRDAILLGTGNIAVVLAQLGFRGILIATLVPAAYGRLSLVLAIYNSAFIVGSTGLPNSVARFLAIGGPAQDSAIIRSALRASAIPIAFATALVATAAGLLLHSSTAALLGGVGLASLIYSLLTMGVLRGRGRMGLAASVMPTVGLAELTPLAILWLSGAAITPLSAFAVFCGGNVIGLITAVVLAKRTKPGDVAPPAPGDPSHAAPTGRQLLGFSMWLALATGGVAILPLVMRSAATIDSYTVVAVVDVALVLFTIPQRLGTVLVLATTTHASQQLRKGTLRVMISRREHLVVILPFVVASMLVAFTPAVSSIFDLIGKPAYDKSVVYLALALLAGPPRILYGLVEGVLIARGQGRFLASVATSITVVAAGLIFAAAALGSVEIAFVMFVAAFWMIYLCGLRRVTSSGRTSSAQPR
jgi:O-antigen/teichoic acid export membrane protein